jgi:hypothetical protein
MILSPADRRLDNIKTLSFFKEINIRPLIVKNAYPINPSDKDANASAEFSDTVGDRPKVINIDFTAYLEMIAAKAPESNPMIQPD